MLKHLDFMFNLGTIKESKDPASKRDFSVHVIQDKPAMIAVEGNVDAKSYLKQFDENKGTIKSKARNIYIFESTSDKKQPGGNIK
ncbi:hypothetical protein IGA_04947 [Bacillus cereus HuA3-9]|uniref:Uncharacterized protein n=1 Tax=Bacillus cereus HuA3-9 TaxID=1053205 RepID=R8CM35_BACCE|nr:hypothetical protein IGA_04947 [Bacillus cereus HuA3-9]